MEEEFVAESLFVGEMAKDRDIRFLIDDYDGGGTEYLNREQVTKLRDWLTKQLRR